MMDPADMETMRIAVEIAEKADPVQRYLKWLREVKSPNEFPTWALEEAEKAIRMRDECAENLAAMFAATESREAHRHARWLQENAHEAAHLWLNLMWSVRRFAERDSVGPVGR